jgi:hypothetical protein
VHVFSLFFGFKSGFLDYGEKFPLLEGINLLKMGKFTILLNCKYYGLESNIEVF